MNASTATPRLTAFPAAPPGDHRSPSKQLLPVRTAYAALAWVVVFFAFHVYWYLGGSFGLGGELPSLVPKSVAGWIVEVLDVVAVAARPMGVPGHRSRMAAAARRAARR